MRPWMRSRFGGVRQSAHQVLAHSAQEPPRNRHLTFDPNDLDLQNRNLSRAILRSAVINSPSFIPISPRTSEKQTFDLWHKRPWPSKNEPIKGNSQVSINQLTKFHPNRPKNLWETDIWPSTPTTLTFKKMYLTRAILGSGYIHPSSLIPIGPRTSEKQTFDLRPQWPWPSKKWTLQGLLGSRYTHPPSLVKIAPRTPEETNRQTLHKL